MAKKSISELTQYFEDSETITFTARSNAERDRDYYDGKQWTDKEIASLKKRKQPVLTFNGIKPKIDALTGMERQNRTDPKALPRNPGDEESAEAATKGLRYVADNTDYDQKRSSFFEDLVIQGIGAGEFGIKITPKDREIVLTNIPWDRFFYDPASFRADFSDALYYGHVIWMDSERAKERFPHVAKELDAIMGQGSASETYDDKPRWIDTSRRRVRIVKMYYISDTNWYVATFTKGLDIENIISPFVDEDNQTYPALNPMSAFVDRENNRYGVVRQMISPQDEINKRRSKLLHLLSVRQVRINPGRNVKAATVRAELAKPDGVIEAKDGDLEILPTNDMSQGQTLLLQDAQAAIDTIGINPTLQGKAGPSLSGRAILAQQSAGAMELGTVTDRKRHWDLKNYRIMYRLMRQFWDRPKWVRITDNNGQPEFIGINQPITVRDQLEANPEVVKALAQQGVDPNTIDLDRVVGYENSIGELDVDIIMEESPDIATLKSEQFELLANSGVLASMPMDVVLELMPNLTGDTKQIIEDKLSGGDDPEQQAQAIAAAEEERQLQLRAANAEIAKDETTAAKNVADAEKTQAETAEIIEGIADDEGAANL